VQQKTGCRPVRDRFGPKPVLDRLTTAKNRLTAVRFRLIKILAAGNQLRLPVAQIWDKRLDRTGPEDTINEREHKKRKQNKGKRWKTNRSHCEDETCVLVAVNKMWVLAAVDEMHVVGRIVVDEDMGVVGRAQ